MQRASSSSSLGMGSEHYAQASSLPGRSPEAAGPGALSASCSSLTRTASARTGGLPKLVPSAVPAKAGRPQYAGRTRTDRASYTTHPYILQGASARGAAWYSGPGGRVVEGVGWMRW